MGVERGTGGSATEDLKLIGGSGLFTEGTELPIAGVRGSGVRDILSCCMSVAVT